MSRQTLAIGDILPPQFDVVGSQEPTKKALNSNTKDDADKVPVFSLALAYFPRAIREVAKVSQFGMIKYNAKPEDKGFLKVPDGRRRYTDGMLRHTLDEVTDGIINVKDGNLRHDAQAAWNALARLEMALIEEEERAAA